jgi:hypothetical protein
LGGPEIRGRWTHVGILFHKWISGTATVN